ncbi:MAG: twin-arginine translocation pathway signal protein [Proteobacteria bacterium]|nr:twin-arginine translocation pathway signal protein [Pseudomonadota bacterium]
MFKPSRRILLSALGGGVALVGAGAAWRVTRVPHKAVVPWNLETGPLRDIRLEAFRHAILAPNPHNRQPWQIRLLGDNEAIVTCDLERRLPETDPFDRQITIGFGAFIELAAIAAAERGYEARITPFPEGAPGEGARLDRRPILHVRFQRDDSIAKDPLFAWITRRRSSKLPYDMSRPVPKDVLSKLSGEAGGMMRFGHAVEADVAARLRDLAGRAMVLELETPHTLKESIDIARVGAAEIDANPDGISLQGPLFEALGLLGSDSVRKQALDPSSNAYRSAMARFARMFAATPAFFWLVSQGNTRAEQVEAGRRYVRLNLAANALGLSVNPVSQALQEYPEMRAHFAAMHAICGAKGQERVQMLARLGYADPVGPSPRWPLGAKLVA